MPLGDIFLFIFLTFNRLFPNIALVALKVLHFRVAVIIFVH